MTRIALVLGAGGLTGQAYHAAVLAALWRVTGYDPRQSDLVVGTSAGSVVAASLRAGLSADDQYARATGRPLTPAGAELIGRAIPTPQLSGTPRQERSRGGPASPRLLGRLAAQPWPPRPALTIAALLPEGRRDPSTWFTPFDVLFPGGRWPDATLMICAVDLDRGVRVAFGADGPDASVAAAVQASCAIPAVFQPVVIGGTRYVDGGVYSPTNADLVCAEETALGQRSRAVAGGLPDAVIVSSPMSGSPVSSRLQAAARFSPARKLAREVSLLRERGIPILVFEPTPYVIDEMGFNAMDSSRGPAVAEAALDHAQALLDSPRAREVARLLAKQSR